MEVTKIRCAHHSIRTLIIKKSVRVPEPYPVLGLYNRPHF